MKKFLVVICVLVGVYIVINLISTPLLFMRGNQTQNTQIQKTLQIIINNQPYTVVVADTKDLRTQGLSGTAVLPYEGMLFVFDKPQKLAFWMKDMHYSLDFLWLDANKQVVDMHQNISPETYPNTIAPHTDAQYVLELPAGFIQKHTVHIEDAVIFP